MFEDYMRDGLSYNDAELKAIKYISSLLEPLGKNINDYKFVPYNVNIEESERLSNMISEEMRYSVSNMDTNQEILLNEHQKQAYDIVLENIFNNKNSMFFIDGPGGTGKTFLYKKLLSAVRSRNYIALAVASSGVAASLLPGGCTAHSKFKIPLESSTETNCSISKQSALADLLRMTKLIVWDEAPMVNRFTIEALDKVLRDINDCDLPFGGKVIVLGGDFRQILPVVPKGSKVDIIKSSLVFSYLWPLFTKLSLVQNMRAHLDISYSNYLLDIGNGLEVTHSCDMITLPSEITIPYKDELVSLNELINVVFPDLHNYADNLATMINRVILTPKNESVDQINTMLLKQIPGQTFTYYSFDESIDKTEQSIQEDFLNTLTPNGIPPHELTLKKNCPIMLLRNINPSEGLCNGTRLVCKNFERNVIDAEISIGEHHGKRVFLPRIPFIPLEGDKNSIPFKRTQFPIRPCFAMTINKAQGQTLDFVGLYLPDPVFSHGQLYVALSRARTSKCIKVLIKPSALHSISLHSLCTKNVVYREILDLVHEVQRSTTI
jgi:hypothetical protein